MTTPAGPTQLSAEQRKKEVRKVRLSAYLGSTIEYYDFLLYASAAALVFGPVFFANLAPAAATIASFGTFATGYLARPIGGIIFGHFGDRVGRKRMLVISMSVMGVASFLIGLVPPASAIGSWGAIILVLLRLGQGVAVGGEWGGAALMALEHSEKKRRGFSAAFTNAGAPSGAVLGTLIMGLFSSLPQEQFLAWGWRVPFLLSAVLLVVGLFVRAKVSESPIFTEAIAQQGTKKTSLPIVAVLRHPKPLLYAAFGCSAMFAVQIMLATFAINYAVRSGSDQQMVLFAFSLSSALSIIAVLGWARVSDRFGRRPVMISGLALLAVLLYPMFQWMAAGEAALVFLAFLVGKTVHSMVYGPMAAFFSEQFGTTSRYTGASVGYQLAALLGAGLTPIALSALYAAYDQNILAVVLFLVAVLAVSAFFLLMARESKDNDLTEDHDQRVDATPAAAAAAAKE